MLYVVHVRVYKQYGASALSNASQNGRADVVYALCNLNANVNIIDKVCSFSFLKLVSKGGSERVGRVDSI